jgi:hypothetical protein
MDPTFWYLVTHGENEASKDELEWNHDVRSGDDEELLLQWWL